MYFFYISDVCCFAIGTPVHVVDGFLCLFIDLNELVPNLRTILCVIKVSTLCPGILHFAAVCPVKTQKDIYGSDDPSFKFTAIFQEIFDKHLALKSEN